MHNATSMTPKLLAVLAVAALAGCGGGVEHNSTCVSGATQACACTSGASGAQTCGGNGTFGECVCDGAGGGHAGTSYEYSLGTDVQRTNWSAGAAYEITQSLCQSLFISNGIYGQSDTYEAGTVVRALGTDCTQLKPTGPGTTGSTSTSWGSSGAAMTNSACPAGQIAIGVAYAAVPGGYSGVGTLCADFAGWADPSASVQPAVAPQVIGDPSNLSFQLTCAQGYALVGLEGYQYDGNVNGQITVFRGVCNNIYRTAQ
jgi:hypothetical protein